MTVDFDKLPEEDKREATAAYNKKDWVRLKLITMRNKMNSGKICCGNTEKFKEWWHYAARHQII